MSAPRVRRPIPDDKLERAVELYKVYLKAKRQDDLSKLAAASPQGLLTPSAIFATTSSIPGRRRAFSAATTSELDGMTDYGSVISGQDDQEPLQNSSASQTDTGPKRTRRKFNEVGRARTHLCRHLGSCDVCKPKGIKVCTEPTIPQ